MKFEIKPPYILFHDDKPASGVTLHVQGDSLPFCGDASSFSDAEKSYSWAFEGKAKEKDYVVFTASDREVSGIVKGGEIVAAVEVEPDTHAPTVVEEQPAAVAADAKPKATADKSGFLSGLFQSKKEKELEPQPKKSKPTTKKK
jgi:hypothetical protein